MTPELVFVKHEIDSYIEVVTSFLAKGIRRIVVRGQGDFLDRFMIKAGELHPRAQLLSHTKADARVSPDKNTAVFLLETSPNSLSAMLMEYADATAGVVCAPITEHHMSRRAAMVNSVPKAGTHLLIELMEAFGFQRPYSEDLPMDEEKLDAGHYYSLQHMTREHLARPRHRIGPFVDAFCRSPLLFMIRDPRDVATSLAHYLSVQTDYHILQSHFASLPKKERLIAAILGDYPLPVYINRNMRFTGSIRDLFMAYADWVRHPLSNTIIFRFEDLIGPRGGGDRRSQLHSTWTAQLALHVPGSPEQYADKVFSPSSLTFRKGQIGSYKKEFGKAHRTAFDSLCPDFREIFGYEDIPSGSHNSYPLWRQFRGEIKLEYGDERPQQADAGPRLAVEGYCGFNVVCHGGRWYGFDQATGPLEIDRLGEADLDDLKTRGVCVTGDSTADVKAEILRLVMQKREQRDSELSAKLEAAAAVVNAFDRRINLGDASLRETAARLDSELKDAAKHSDERLSDMGARLEERLGEIEARLKDYRTSLEDRLASLTARVETELQETAKHNETRLAEMAAALERGQASLAGNLSSLTARLEGELNDVSKRSDEHWGEMAARLERDLQEAAKHSDERLSQMASRLEQRQDSLTSHLESELKDAAKRSDERLSEISSRLEQRQELLAQRISRIAPEPEGAPRLIEEGYCGFNLIAQGNKIWAVEMAAGPLDFTDAGALEAWLADGRLLRATTVDGARAAVDRLLDRRTFEAGLSRLASTLESQITSLTARLASGLEEASKHSDKRLDEMTARMSQRQVLLEGHLTSLAEQVETGLQETAKHNETRVAEMAAALEQGQASLAGSLSSLTARLKGELNDVSKRGDEHWAEMAVRLERDLREMAARSAERLSEMEARLNQHQTSLEGRLTSLIDRLESGLKEAARRSDERQNEMTARLEQRQQSMVRQVEERLAALERPWWQRLAAKINKKNQG